MTSKTETGQPEDKLAFLRSQVREIFTVESNLFRDNFGDLCRLEGKTLAEYQDPRLEATLLAFHKLLFLTGGDEADVITAQDGWGNYIYTKLFHGEAKPDPKRLDRKKFPVKEGEIQEANGAISGFIQQVKSQAQAQGVKHYEVDPRQFLGPLELPEVLSEVADITFNLLNIGELDRDYNYFDDVEALSSALGLTTEQMLQLVVSKYEYRYLKHKGIKNIQEENEIIRLLIENGSTPVPDLGQLSRAYNEINTIANKIIRPRLDQLNIIIDRMIRRDNSPVPLIA